MDGSQDKSSETSREGGFLPARGERTLIVGQTGSGKSVFEHWLLARHESAPIVIYDTKEEPKFETLKNSRIAETLNQVNELLDEPSVDYIIFRPHVSIVSDPHALDDLLYYHYSNWRDVSAFIDEITSFHNNGRAGNGLVGLLTRGRSRGITTVMASQRPRWLSTFALTESQKYYIFKLVDKKDRDRVGDVVPDFSKMKQPPKYHFYFFEHGMEKAELYKPIDIDPDINTGYTDKVKDQPGGSDTLSRYEWL